MTTDRSGRLRQPFVCSSILVAQSPGRSALRSVVRLSKWYFGTGRTADWLIEVVYSIVWSICCSVVKIFKHSDVC